MMEKDSPIQQPVNLHKRILEVMRVVRYVQKESKKVNNQYTFVSHDAVVGAVRDAMVDRGIVSTVDVVSRSQDGTRTEVDIEMTFINVDDPQDRFLVHGFGYGIDPQDKGPGKAISYAVKYVLLKTFMIETGDDPERDNNNHEKPPRLKTETPPANGNGAHHDADPPAGDSPPPNNAEREAAKAVAVELQRLAESMKFTNADLGDVVKTVYNAKKFTLIPAKQIAELKKDLALKASLFPQIRDAVIRQQFDREGFEPDKDMATAIDKTHEVLANKASLDYASRPLRAPASVWQEWLKELTEREPVAA